MYIFIECWKPRAEWLALSPSARAAYMDELGKGIEGLISSGVEIVTWSLNDADVSQRSPYDYFAVWKFPTRESAREFEQIVEQSGWYTYFSQSNLVGKAEEPGSIIRQLIAL